MITQTPISVRMNTWLLDDLNREVSLGYHNRNKIINDAVRFYLQMKDATRRTDEDVQKVIDYWNQRLRW